MKSFLALALVMCLAASLAVSAPAFARKAEPSGKLIKQAETYAATQHFGRKKIVINGKEWDAEKYCNEATMKNPSQLELYKIKGRSEVVALCPAGSEKGENVISVFPKSGWPKERRAKASTGKRVSDEVLRNSVIRLLKK